MKNKASEKLSNDFNLWVNYWDLYEEDGLTPFVTEAISQYICSPVILLGSGQGLVSKNLMLQGKKVTSIDACPEMADRAKKRRGIPTIVGDATTIKLQQKFNSVIVSTGILFQQQIYEDFTEKLLTNIRLLSQTNSRAIFCYFWYSPWERVKQSLGFYNKSSSNGIYFWKARGNLEKLKYLLITEAGVSQRTIDEIFDQWEDALQNLLNQYLKVGERFKNLNNNEDPEPYFAFYDAENINMSLTEQDELELQNKLNIFNFDIEKTFNFYNSTRVLVCTIKGH
jgi:Methyltransferase domain